MKIVGISGKMHSGKTWVSDILRNKGGYTRVSYAGPLKEDVLNMGFDPAHVLAKPDWMRNLLIAYGQARRAVNPDHWVERVGGKLRALLAEERKANADLFGPGREQLVVIDDLRFENEADALRMFEAEFGGVDLMLVRLERRDYDRAGLAGTGDISETALDDYDFDYTYYVASGDTAGLDIIGKEILEEAMWTNSKPKS